MRCPLTGACTNSPCASTSPLAPRSTRKPWVALSAWRTAIGAADADALVSAIANRTPGPHARTDFDLASSVPAGERGSRDGRGRPAGPPRELPEPAGAEPDREGHEQSRRPDGRQGAEN